MDTQDSTTTGSSDSKQNDVYETPPSFPFTTVIVTNPDEASAQSAQRFLDSTLKSHLEALYSQQYVRLLSTYDPFGARCGSFGGTLAAVDLLDAETLSKETILCLHAGGDSSRCPLSMIIGKAWQELPSTRYRNPTFWLIHQMTALFHVAQIPMGSLLVAATDCLISFGLSNKTDPSRVNTESVQTIDPSTILGVGVPAPLYTAKNHGVYIMPESVINNPETSSLAIQMEDPIDVWQKPDVDKLSTGTCGIEATPACFKISHRSGKQAWIDVGIVIFYPVAFQKLVSLSNGILSKCTRTGLQKAFENSEEIKSTGISLEAFAKKNAIKVDLYTDILHNLPRTNKARRSNDKVDMKGNICSQMEERKAWKASLRDELAKLSLKVLLIPEGNFLHLGTTTELLEFVTTGSYYQFEQSMASNTIKVVDKAVAQALAKSLQLSPRCQSYGAPPIVDWQNVVVRSIFPSSIVERCTIGKSTLIEHSDLCIYDSICIEDNCMLSGWRFAYGALTEKSDTHPLRLHIPDGLSVQLMSIQPDVKGDDHEQEYALVVLGTDDPIKAPLVHSTLFNVLFEDFLIHCKLEYAELGLHNNDCLWTAKVHPIIKESAIACSMDEMYRWIGQLRSGDSELLADSSFQRWLSARRVSLKDLHDIADAKREWDFRSDLDSRIWLMQSDVEIQTIRKQVMERCHTAACDLSWLMNVEDREMATTGLWRLISALEMVAEDGLDSRSYDVSSRAFLLASAILADFGSRIAPRAVSNSMQVPKSSQVLLADLKKSSTYTESMDQIAHLVKTILRGRCKQLDHARFYQESSSCFEALALKMTEFVISDGFRQFLDPTKSSRIAFARHEIPILNQWVVAVAPARVDLAGGWSDTPPICYEYGGSVTGMAVLVDKRYPLSCRCRVIPGKTGIFLRSEMREISNGSLLLSQENEIDTISDLQGYRDPSALCALIKAALVCLGMVTEQEISESSDLQRLLNWFCSSTTNVRLEVTTISLLGLGTGLGTSSILGACILQSIARCVGIGELDDNTMLHAVLMLEQILSSGGGWQDQAHGILPGIKTVRSQPNEIPLKIQCERIDLPETIVAGFEDRLMFTYTGQTRLAKNILQHVLRRWSRRSNEIVKTVESLVHYSEAAHDALIAEDWDAVAEAMQQGYCMKCRMAGQDSGAEPETVTVFIRNLLETELIRGAMLCGAGGGGFLMLLRSINVNAQDIKDFFKNNIAPLDQNFGEFSFHDCSIARKGLTTFVLDDKMVDAYSFDMTWHEQ